MAAGNGKDAAPTPPAVTPELELHDFVLRSLKGVCGAYERYLYRKYGYKLTPWQYHTENARALLQEQERQAAGGRAATT